MKVNSMILGVATSSLLVMAGCSSDMMNKNMNESNMSMHNAMDPNMAEVVAVDRFSKSAGHLMVRTAANGLPATNEPIDFDHAPFITHGLSAKGDKVKYYNFDVQSTASAPIYVLFRQGEMLPVEGQLNIVNVIPGDKGYSDFWHVHKVNVPSTYVANTATSLKQIEAMGFSIEKTNKLVNCPVVPDGSVARLRSGKETAGLHSGWYKDKVVKYFTFEEKDLNVDASGDVDVSPIYVTFNVNPNKPNGGPATGFKTEKGSAQTHNVIETIPSDADYSPLWLVSVYDNADWAKVDNLESAQNSNILASGIATVNCPVVEYKHGMM